MTFLCPRGHRVRVLKDGSGNCGTCEHKWPKSFLIPVVGHVGKRNYELYAHAYRQGWRDAKESRS